MYLGVTYDVRYSIDEEYTRELRFMFKQPIKSLVGKTLDVQKDTAIVKASYDNMSVWDWGSSPVNGKITVKDCNAAIVKLRMDLYIYDGIRTGIQHYRGTRKFKCSKDSTGLFY